MNNFFQYVSDFFIFFFHFFEPRLHGTKLKPSERRSRFPQLPGLLTQNGCIRKTKTIFRRKRGVNLWMFAHTCGCSAKVSFLVLEALTTSTRPCTSRTNMPSTQGRALHSIGAPLLDDIGQRQQRLPGCQPGLNAVQANAD